MSKILLSFVFCLLAYASPALAASPEEELETTQKNIEEAQERQSTIAEKSSHVTEELTTLQAKLVKAADALQKAEVELTDAENKLQLLTQEFNVKNDTLKTQQNHLSALIIAELSLSHTPPEAMLMMPGDPIDIVKAARALSITSESIRQEAQSLSLQLVELQKLKAKVTEHRNQMAALQANLDKQHRELVSQVAERTALQNKLSKQQKQAEIDLAHLAKKASDLRDLISGIEKEEDERENAEVKHPKPMSREYLRSFTQAKGHMRAPAAGQLVQKFGSSEGRNTTSKGFTIATRARAQVVAPYDGEVVFTGPFLNYGRMIILRHSDDFHTLLAGLVKIDVKVGQFLLEGEPIGAMGEGDSGNAGEHKLYIELRKNNQPVDPTLWIAGLNKKK